MTRFRTLFALACLVAPLACAGGGSPTDPTGGGPSPSSGSLTVLWDGRVAEWGAPDTLRALRDGAPADVEWVSLSDLYEDAPVVLGRGAAITTATLRPGTTTIEARLVSGGRIVDSRRVEVEVRYRESWNMTLEAQVPYEDQTVGDVWVSGGYAFVARRHAGGISIVALDGGVREVGRWTSAGLFTQDVKAAGGIAYVSNEPTQGSTYPLAVTLLDVSDPAHPAPLGGVPMAVVGAAHNVWIDGDLLTLASQATRAFHLYDVSDPSAPRPLSTVHAADAVAHDIHTRDGMLFGSSMALSAGMRAELTVASVADPAHPAILARATYPGALLTHESWLSRDGRTLYVTDEIVNAPVRIFDVSDPSRPTLVATYQPRLGTIPHNFAVRDGTTAYLSDYKHGVEALDVSDPRHPRLVGFYDTHPGIDDDGAVPSGVLTPAHEKEGALYEGAWGVHWTDDGRIVVSDMNRGLFVLRLTR